MTLDTKQELVISQNIGGQLQVSANVNKPKKTESNSQIKSFRGKGLFKVV